MTDEKYTAIGKAVAWKAHPFNEVQPGYSHKIECLEGGRWTEQVNTDVNAAPLSGEFWRLWFDSLDRARNHIQAFIPGETECRIIRQGQLEDGSWH